MYSGERSVPLGALVSRKFTRPWRHIKNSHSQYFYIGIIVKETDSCEIKVLWKSPSSSSSSGTWSPSIGFAGCIWCYIRRTHWPAIRNWKFYQAVLLLSMPHSPYYFFLGAECMTLLMPSLHLCMHVCGECWRVCNWSVCPGLGFHQLFIVPGHRKQCEHR